MNHLFHSPTESLVPLKGQFTFHIRYFHILLSTVVVFISADNIQILPPHSLCGSLGCHVLHSSRFNDVNMHRLHLHRQRCDRRAAAE